MSLDISVLNQICGDREQLLRKLQQWQLIPKEGTYTCVKCNGLLSLCPDASRPEGWIWRCKNVLTKNKQKAKKCEKVYAFRLGTIFFRSKFSIFEILAFINLWTGDVKLKTIKEILKFSSQSIVDWSYFCREILLESFVINREKLGGAERMVIILEAKFGNGETYQGLLVEGQLLFCGYEQGTARIFMVIVEDRGFVSLLPIIEDWIEPDTIISSDFWKNYDCGEFYDYEELKINHNLQFMDLKTDTDANDVKNSWLAAKAAGYKRTSGPGYLAKFIFNKRCKELDLERTVEFYRIAGELYNPIKPARAPPDIICDEATGPCQVKEEPVDPLFFEQ